MSGQVTHTSHDGVAVVLIDNPPVNALGPAVVDGLAAAMNQAERNPAIQAIVVMGAGRTFVAGAEGASKSWNRPRGASAPVLRTSTVCSSVSKTAPSQW